MFKIFYMQYIHIYIYKEYSIVLFSYFLQDLLCYLDFPILSLLPCLPMMHLFCFVNILKFFIIDDYKETIPSG